MRLQSNSGCPPAATLAAVADGGLAPAERDIAVAHIADCERCLAELAAIVRLSREPVRPLPAALLERAAQPRRVRWQPVAALAATLLISIGGWWLSTPEERLASPTATAAGEAVRSLASGSDVPVVIQPPANGRQSSRAVTFSWQPVSSALTYRLRVMRDDGQLVWEAETTSTSMHVADAASLPAAIPLYVSVTAVLPDGRTTRAPAVPFTVLQE